MPPSKLCDSDPNLADVTVFLAVQASSKVYSERTLNEGGGVATDSGVKQRNAKFSATATIAMSV